jgi:hypothetical protein
MDGGGLSPKFDGCATRPSPLLSLKSVGWTPLVPALRAFYDGLLTSFMTASEPGATVGSSLLALKRMVVDR